MTRKRTRMESFTEDTDESTSSSETSSHSSNEDGEFDYLRSSQLFTSLLERPSSPISLLDSLDNDNPDTQDEDTDFAEDDTEEEEPLSNNDEDYESNVEESESSSVIDNTASIASMLFESASDLIPTVYVNSDGEEYTSEQIEEMSDYNDQSLSASTESFSANMTRSDAEQYWNQMFSNDLIQLHDSLIQHNQSNHNHDDITPFLSLMSQMITTNTFGNVLQTISEHSPSPDTAVSIGLNNPETFETEISNSSSPLSPQTVDGYDTPDLQSPPLTPPRRLQALDLQLNFDTPLNFSRTLVSSITPMTRLGLSRRQIRRNMPTRRSFDLYAESIILLPNVVFTVEDYELMNAHFVDIVNNGIEHHPSSNILNLMLEVWHQSGRQDFVDLDRLIRLIINEITSPSLVFDHELSVDELYDVIEHWVSHYGYVPNLRDCSLIHQYLVIHDVYPAIDQLTIFTNRISEFFSDPERFFQMDRIMIPTANLESLPQSEHTEGELSCGICQEDVKIGQMVVELPQCHHRFHAKESECLENASVFNWLRENCVCPMCKTRVS